MTEEEKRMEECNHAWLYAEELNCFEDTVMMRCTRCGMVRPLLPGESAVQVCRPQKTKEEDIK